MCLLDISNPVLILSLYDVYDITSFQRDAVLVFSMVSKKY
jgi:hypothetical protein